MLFKSIKDFIALDENGWLIGPAEEEKNYFSRIERLKHYFTNPPSQLDHFLTDTDFAPAIAHTKELYNIAPDWVVATYSNQNLSFFQGAATWIDTKGPIPIPTIQLKKKFASGSLFGLYKRDEILSHEIIHAARMSFDEPLFEEFFAYRTSKSFFRRFLGPLFQSPWEANLFILLLLIPIAITLTEFFYYDLGPWRLLQYLPLVFFSLLFIRLLFLHSVLFLASRRLKWPVLLRLTDKEIFFFAFSSKKKIAKFLKKATSLRWKIIKEYLP